MPAIFRKQSEQGQANPVVIIAAFFLVVSALVGTTALLKNNFDIRQRAQMYCTSENQCLSGSNGCCTGLVQSNDASCGTIPVRCKTPVATPPISYQKRYGCVNGSCTQQNNGEFLSVSECSSSCHAPVPTPLRNRQIGESCTNNSDCITNNCSGGKCSAVPASCPKSCEKGCYGSDGNNDHLLDCIPFCKSSYTNGCLSETSTGGIPNTAGQTCAPAGSNCDPNSSNNVTQCCSGTTCRISSQGAKCEVNQVCPVNCPSGCSSGTNICNPYCDSAKCPGGCDYKDSTGGKCTPYQIGGKPVEDIVTELPLCPTDASGNPIFKNAQGQDVCSHNPSAGLTLCRVTGSFSYSLYCTGSLVHFASPSPSPINGCHIESTSDIVEVTKIKQIGESCYICRQQNTPAEKVACNIGYTPFCHAHIPDNFDPNNSIPVVEGTVQQIGDLCYNCDSAQLQYWVEPALCSTSVDSLSSSDEVVAYAQLLEQKYGVVIQFENGTYPPLGALQELEQTLKQLPSNLLHSTNSGKPIVISITDTQSLNQLSTAVHETLGGDKEGYTNGGTVFVAHDASCHSLDLLNPACWIGNRIEIGGQQGQLFLPGITDVFNHELIHANDEEPVADPAYCPPTKPNCSLLEAYIEAAEKDNTQLAADDSAAYAQRETEAVAFDCGAYASCHESFLADKPNIVNFCKNVVYGGATYAYNSQGLCERNN